MQRVCAAGRVLTGYDVSHYEPDLSIHRRRKAAGDVFCFIKCDEGARVVDHLFQVHWREAKAQGMIVAPYNFFHPAQDPIAQAKHLESLVGKLAPEDLGPIIDWETSDGVGVIKDREEGFQFLMHVQGVLKKRAILYGGSSFLNGLSLDSRFLAFILWIANYGVSCPSVPGPFKTWDFWQFSGTTLDLNRYNGTMEQLKALAAPIA